MTTSRWLIWLILVNFCLLSCAGLGMAYQDHYYYLDPPNHNLRGKTPKDDLAESRCDPQRLQDGKLSYQCVVHLEADYRALVTEVDRLETELTACQQGHKP